MVMYVTSDIMSVSNTLCVLFVNCEIVIFLVVSVCSVPTSSG